MPASRAPLPVLHRPWSRRALLTAGAAGAAAVTVAGCSSAAGSGSGQAAVAALRRNPPPPVDPAKIGANELGMVPVMMHHRITANVDSEFDMTPEFFRAELEELYADGYRPVRTVDLVHGSFNVPPGTTPFALTFDDGTSGQFGYAPDGRIDPKSGVGILLAVAAKHGDGLPGASFYVNAAPFELANVSAGLGDLHGHGFEIGNHTYDHVNLHGMDSTRVQKELVELQRLVTGAVRTARVRTMALPFGVEPDIYALAHAGSWEGQSYLNEGVLLVGANPAHSPFHQDFDPLAIPRIRCSSYHGGTEQYGHRYWLDYFKAHPGDRYRAAGIPGKITFPKAYAASLASAFAAQANPY